MATTKELTAKENDVREVYKKSVQETASCIFILQHSQTNDQAEIIREAREELEQGREPLRKRSMLIHWQWKKLSCRAERLYRVFAAR